MDFTELFCSIDDFTNRIMKRQAVTTPLPKSKRGVAPQMHLSEMMTIIVGYHVLGFKNFKTYYFYLCSHHRSEFPTIISYNRFVEWIPLTLVPLCLYLRLRM